MPKNDTLNRLKENVGEACHSVVVVVNVVVKVMMVRVLMVMVVVVAMVVVLSTVN